MDRRFHRKSWRRKNCVLMGSSSHRLLSSSTLDVMLVFLWILISCSCVSHAVQVTSTFRSLSFSQEPESLVAAEDQAVRFYCKVNYTGRESVAVHWFKDGQLIRSEERRKYQEDGLYIRSVQSSMPGETDQGEYVCSATVSGLGTILSKKANLTLPHVPKHFEEEPKNLQLAPGDWAAFECLINSHPPATVQWFKGPTRLLPNAKTRIFPTGLIELGPISSSEYGQYGCEVEVQGKLKVSNLATLSSSNDAKNPGPPKFVIRPRSQRVHQKQTAYLHCVAHGRDMQGKPPIISWLKDGSTIKLGANSTKMHVEGTGTLVIKAVTEEDAGDYTCRAVNSIDSEDADASLTVLVPPSFVVTPKNILAHPKTDVIFDCKATGIPQPEVTWVKDGQVVTNGDYFQIQSQGSLQVLGVLPTDQGMYQCFAKNDVGSTQATAQLLLSQEAPQNSVFHSHPFPLTAGSLYEMYSSTAPAPINLRAAIVRIRFVTLKWEIPNSSEVFDLQGNRNITFTVYWKEIGSERERVSNTTVPELTINGLKPKTQYEFRVRSYNKGYSKREAKVSITTEEDVSVPSPPVNLQAVTLSSTEIQVKWQPPVEPKGTIKHYTLIYYMVKSGSENQISTKETSVTLNKLQKFREYSFRVEANNENGRGVSTSEVFARTYSDVPTDTPQNFTLELTSSTSVVVRWQPPPETKQNGIITGYKIRVKAKGEPAQTVPTDGDRNSYSVTNLSEGTDYMFRISAITVNGSGPLTPWEHITTYKDDLQETTVPPEPAKLYAQPKANSILVSWAPPPPHSKILVRGYVLGYGKGIADVYKHSLDANTHQYHIQNLQPSSQYVITIRAFNALGQGPSRYETVITPDETEVEFATPMLPPIGLNAHVLSHHTILLTWSDNSLSKNQKITDNRYYTIKYRQASRQVKYRYINATDLNCHIDGLRPHTEYEFMVKVIKGRRESDYSMTVVNKTDEAEPSTEPRDLTPVPDENNPLLLTLNWQPPSKPNGQITGYLIYYSTDDHTDEKMWPVEGVVGDKLSTVIDKLTPDTKYHFMVQARNSKGFSPKSQKVTYITPSVANPDKNNDEKEKGLTTNVIIIIAACVAGFVFCTVVIVIIVCLCRCRGNRAAGQTKIPVKASKVPPPSVKPPDLWIHQPNSHLELHKMERSNRSESSASVATSTLRRGSRGSADHTDDQASTLDRRRNSFVDDRGYPSSGEERYQPIQPRNLIRPKPVALPMDNQLSFREPIATVTAAPNGHILQYGDNSGNGQLGMRPIYPRTQYNTQYTSAARVNAGDLPHTCPPSSKMLTAVDEDERDGSVDMVGAMDESYNSRIGYVKPQQNISPYKKPTAPVMSTPNKGQRTPIPFNSKSPDLKGKKDEADLSKSLSTEELTAEMANLEGLMKDLNAITQQEFEC
ncbi:neogenin-like isoform X2 [Physella acuta]|uniref:neogenin-like isoform X2 n=1 Tax=Physella acuta TaxID=109671 RepID=UPI0027DDDFE1|nr:neogenin-like isoform X2 [Physella acuta]